MQPAALSTGSDMELWSRFKEGNESAFKDLFYRYSDAMLQYGLSIVQDRDFVKDCMQDFFVDLWQQRECVSAAYSVKFYLLISIRRRILKSRKSVKKQALVRQLLSNEDAADSSIMDEYFNREEISARKELIQREVNLLPARQREALYLRYFACLDYPQIQEIMNLNYQVVRNMIFRAIKTLRARLSRLKPAINLFLAFAIYLSH